VSADGNGEAESFDGEGAEDEGEALGGVGEQDEGRQGEKASGGQDQQSGELHGRSFPRKGKGWNT
jgi:hypothetical protein